MECPICGNDLTTEYQHGSAYGTEESLVRCKHCNLYAEQFAYGGTEICVGDFTIHMWHGDSNEKKNFLNRQIKEIAQFYKQIPCYQKQIDDDYMEHIDTYCP